MNTLSIILGIQISLLEIIIFQVGAAILGFAIHFFISSKKNIQIEKKPVETGISDADQWRLKYYEELDLHEKRQEELRKKVQDAQDLEEQFEEELSEMRRETKRMIQEQEAEKNRLKEEFEKQLQEIKAQFEEKEKELQAKPAELPTLDYLDELKKTQTSLLDHNQRISRLLEQIDFLKDAEQKHMASTRLNEQLQAELRDIKRILNEKEAELKHAKQQQDLAKEMQDRLKQAYGEFSNLQEKIHKVETHIVQPQNRNFEYEELQQSYFKLSKEFDELKTKHLSMMEENQRLSRLLTDVEDKLREANFNRQQLAKKVNFLEELNGDLQQVAEHNKKLENQLRRIGEIEGLLAKISAMQGGESNPTM